MRQLTQGIRRLYFLHLGLRQDVQDCRGQIGLHNGDLTYLLFRLRLRILAYIANHMMQNFVRTDLVTQIF